MLQFFKGTSSSSTTSSLMPSSSSGAVAIVEQQMNFLENILNAQSNFFTNSSSSRSDNLRNEIYTRPDLEKEYPGPNGRLVFSVCCVYKTFLKSWETFLLGQFLHRPQN